MPAGGRPAAAPLVVCATVWWARGASARPGGKGRAPVMGWNTWCTQNRCTVDWCSSAEVLDVARYMNTSGMLAAGYDHVLLDDCWGVRNVLTREIEGDKKRFPEGMPSLIDKVHQLGLKFGVYTARGSNGCHHPYVGSWPYYQQDANTFRDWGVDYVKMDGCDHSGRNATELTCEMSTDMNNTGRDMWLNFHCWGDAGCAACGNSFRISNDHRDNWNNTLGIIDLLRERRDYWGAAPERGWPDPDFIYTGGEGCGDHSEAGQRCPGQTEEEYVTEFSVWAVAGGQLVLASDPRNMSALQRRVLLNAEVLAVFRDAAGFGAVREVVSSAPPPAPPPGAECALEWEDGTHNACAPGKRGFGCSGGQMWAAGGCHGKFTCGGVAGVECGWSGGRNETCPCIPRGGQVWVRPLSGAAAAVALVNTADAPRDVTVRFADVPLRGWGAATALGVRDLWRRAEVGRAVGSYTATGVAAHGTVLLRLSPA